MKSVYKISFGPIIDKTGTLYNAEKKKKIII